MVFCNCQFVVRACCYFSGVFCLLFPNFQMSNRVLKLYRAYGFCLVVILLYLFQYFVRGKFAYLFPRMSLLFIVLDLLDCAVPLIAVISAIFYATVFKHKAFILFNKKFIDSDAFLGEHYSNTKRVALLLLIECLSLAIFYFFFLYILTYLVDLSYGVYYKIPKNNISYCITISLFLITICNIRIFIVLIRTVLSGTNKKLTHNIDGVLAFTHYKQQPLFLPKFDIHPFLVQYKTCFELIRLFNDYFGFQVLILTCASFLVLVNNMYLSTLKLKDTVLEFIPPYILFFRHITNTAMYLVIKQLFLFFCINIFNFRYLWCALAAVGIKSMRKSKEPKQL